MAEKKKRQQKWPVISFEVPPDDYRLLKALKELHGSWRKMYQSRTDELLEQFRRAGDATEEGD